MGLDMYLSKRIIVGNCKVKVLLANQNYGFAAMLKGKEFDSVEEIRIKVAYWRKANAIHKWFVDTVQNGEDDCKEHYFERKKLMDLLDICEKVVSNPKLASKLLPVTEGFFFGTKEYGKEYMEELKYTIEILKKIREEPEDYDEDYCYQSCW